ncbi:MAG: hypothetical protein JSR44_16335 [Spirochaetes bacterium]|nr:hypothetical protein [Spirochaetota bacterium]
MYENLFGSEPEIIEEQAHKYALRIETDEYDALVAQEAIQPSERALPFRYYDATYAARVKRGYEFLGDLVSGYKDDVLNEKLLKGVAKAYPKLVRYHVIGKTRLGRKLIALEISRPSQQPKFRTKILFTGSIHGSEMTSTEHCYRILHDILGQPQKYRKVLENHVIWMIPLINPDGAHFFWHTSLQMGRKNGYLAPGQARGSWNRGVDLNRNFPFRWKSGVKRASSGDPESYYYRGPRAASEPETRAIMKLARAQRFLYAISFHSVASKLLFPYTIDNTTNPAPDIAQSFALQLAQLVDPVQLGRAFTAVKKLYAVDGTDQDYFYHAFGTLAYILETSYENCEYRFVPVYLEHFSRLTDAFLFDYGKRKKFALKIVDTEGNPLAAKIRFSDQEFFEGEVRKASAHDGSFVRLTNSNAVVTVTIRAKGFKTRRLSLKPQHSAYPKLRTIQLQHP